MSYHLNYRIVIDVDKNGFIMARNWFCKCGEELAVHYYDPGDRVTLNTKLVCPECKHEFTVMT